MAKAGIIYRTGEYTATAIPDKSAKCFSLLSGDILSLDVISLTCSFSLK